MLLILVAKKDRLNLRITKKILRELGIITVPRDDGYLIQSPKAQLKFI